MIFRPDIPHPQQKDHSLQTLQHSLTTSTTKSIRMAGITKIQKGEPNNIRGPQCTVQKGEPNNIRGPQCTVQKGEPNNIRGPQCTVQ